MRSNAARAYSLLFFFSGATGLVYELLWVRILYQAFGSTIQSITPVVAAYMGGLGLGAWLLGRKADRQARPAALYGWLEIAIGAFGLASPFVLSLAHRVYIGAAGALDLGAAASVALRFGLAALVLLVPTTLMGGTLPALTKGFMGVERDRLQTSLGRLYALNTLGAVVGTALAGFFLIERVGIRSSLYATAALNLSRGAAALALARPLEPSPPAPPPAARPPDLTRRVALALLAVTAFASLLDEIAWTRVLVMVVGGSTYAFTLVLLVFLLGIGLGSAIVARRGSGRPPPVADAALAQGITGAGAALLLAFFGALPLYVIKVFGHPGCGATDRLALLGVAVGAVVLIPAVGMGLSFPLLADLAAPRDTARGADVGVAYALNTLGSIALGAAFGAPGWSSRLIDLGPTIYARDPMGPAARQAFLAHRGARQLAFREGWNATVSVWEGISGRTLRVNGKVDASDQGDMDTQIMLGLAPAAARPEATSALVSGVTTRVLADVPGMRRVRVVEIEPAVLSVSGLFARVNDSVLARPTVSAVADDARSALQLRRDRFDVIVSEPSNPWVAGVATLYTPEFFRIVRSRLADGGVFSQWVQLYQLPLPVVAGIVRNVRAVFPHVEVWFSSSLDLMILGSDQPLRYDRAWIGRLLDPGTPLGGVSREWLGIDSVGDHFGRRLLDEAGVAQLVERGTLTHRDDRPELEFVAARRFLDPVWDSHVFDSLMALEVRVGGHPGTTPVLLARAMTSPRIPSTQGPILEAAHRAQPDNPVWLVRVARMRFAAGDSAFVDSVLPGLVRTRNPEALLFAAALAARRGDQRRRAALLREALARGGDTAEADAGLAAVAARDADWPGTAAALRRSLAIARATYRHPFPAGLLHDPLAALALTGPIRLADSVLAAAGLAHPGWTTPYELRAAIALRDGRCEDAASQFLALAEFGIEVADAPDRLMRCRGPERR